MTAIVTIVVVVAAVVAFVATMIKSKPPETIPDLIAAHRKIVQKVKTGFGTAAPTDGAKTLGNLHSELEDMRPAIEKLKPESSAQRFQRTWLLQANSKLAEAAELDPAELTKQLGLKTEFNLIAQADELINDAESPVAAMDRNEEKARMQAVNDAKQKARSAIEAARKGMEGSSSSGEASKEIGAPAPPPESSSPEPVSEPSSPQSEDPSEAARKAVEEQRRKAIDGAEKALNQLERATP